MDLCEFETSLEYRVRSRAAKDTQRNPVSESRNLKNKSKRNRVKKKQSHIKMENIQRILILYAIMLSLNCLNAEEGYLFINATKLIQYKCFEITLTSKLKSKGMLLWRRDSAFVSTENERLWIYSELRKIIFDQGRPPEKSTGTDGPDDRVLHPELIQDCCLR